MLRSKRLIWVIFTVLGFTGYSQNGTALLNRFNNGKDLYGLEKYRLAMEEFRQVLTKTENNPYTEYASYYFAVSAYKSGQKSVAKSMFHQIERKYYNWDKIDEVYYWLANIEFEGEDYLTAMIILGKIESPTLQMEAETMKRHYLKKLKNVEDLSLILSKNPYDKVVAEALAEAVIEQPIAEQDLNLLEFLVSEFELDKKKFDVASSLPIVRKEEYNVAVVLPFMVDNLNVDNLNLGRNLVVDLYEGIRVGVDKLEKKGIKINLQAFDTKRDSVTIMKLVESGSLDKMDLIIGPLSRVASNIMSNYCYQHKKNMINPLSYNSEVMGNNPFSFLFKPSVETQALKAAEFAVDTFENKNMEIIYGLSAKDSIMAHVYKNRIELDSFKVVNMHQVAPSNAKKIISLLVEENGEKTTTTSKDPLDGILEEENPEIGHIFLASDNDLLMANTIAALEVLEEKIPLIGTESWLESGIIEYDQIERLGVYIISPNYIDFNKQSIDLFRVFYHNRTNIYPSRYAYNGYELMIVMGELLNRYGVYFQNGLKVNPEVRGEIYEGFNYSLGNDNQHTPIIKFEESQLKVVNN